MYEQLQHSNQEPEEALHKLQPEFVDLERALAQIQSPQAAAITLNLSMGYSHSEISDILDLPLGTVKSHITRGITKLKELMTEKTEGVKS